MSSVCVNLRKQLRLTYPKKKSKKKKKKKGN